VSATRCQSEHSCDTHTHEHTQVHIYTQADTHYFYQYVMFTLVMSCLKRNKLQNKDTNEKGQGTDVDVKPVKQNTNEQQKNAGLIIKYNV